MNRIPTQHTPILVPSLGTPEHQNQPEALPGTSDTIQDHSPAGIQPEDSARHRLFNQIAAETGGALGLTAEEMQGISAATQLTLGRLFRDLQKKGLGKEQILAIARGPHASDTLTTFHGFNALRTESMPLQRLTQIVHRDHYLNQGEWAKQQTPNIASTADNDGSRRNSKRLRMKSSATTTAADMSALAPELPPPPPPVEGMRAWRMNSAQIAYVRDSEITNHGMEIFNSSTNDAPSTETAEVIVATGKQVYDARLRFLFPIRDVSTIDQVAPAYAHPENPYLCSPNVRVTKVIFTKSMEKKLCDFAKENIGKGKMFLNKKAFIDAIKESCSTMLTYSMRGAAAPASNDLQIIVVREEHCDNDVERKALVGTYGAKPANYAHDAQPGIWLGKVACFFGGVKCLSPEEQDIYMAHFGDEEGTKAMKDYGINVQPYGKKKESVYAPYGTGDPGQLINSTFKPMANGQMAVDGKATNAFFDPVTFELTDKDGKDCTETISAVWLHKDADLQIKVHYGEKYKMGTPAKRGPSWKGWARISASPEPEDTSTDVDA